MSLIKLLTTIMMFILIFNISPTSAQQTIIFSSTSIKVEIEGNLVDSNNVRITLTNSPNLPKGFSYQVSFEDGFGQIFGSEGGLIETNSNLVSKGRIINFMLIGPSNEFDLVSREANSITWSHVKHIYANWTFGSNPPPDRRGFGQGAIIDSMILDSIIDQNITSEDELITLAEDIFNLLFGSSADFNGDNTVKLLSDSWGLYNYTIGMRDHMRNAGNGEPDPTSEIAKLSEIIVTNFANIVEEGDPGSVYANLANSETVFGQIFQSIIHINQNLTESKLNAATASLKNNVTELTGFIIQNYEEFRSSVFNFKATISDFTISITEGSISSSTTSNPSTTKSNDSPIHFEIIFLSMIFITIITSKLHVRKKKV